MMLEFMGSQSGLVIAAAIFAAGASGALLFGRNNRLADLWGGCFALCGSALGLVFSCAVLFTGHVLVFSLPTTFPLLSLSFRVDQLSAFFILVISLIALLCSIYALGYVRHYYGRYNIGALGFFYNLFIAAMILVVAADNALLFVIAWEIMSLASYFLVIFEHREERNIRAGSLYFIMTHAGTAFIVLAFLLLYGETGTFEFDAMGSSLANATPLFKSAVFVLALIGFGAKAGLIPLHIWLPAAHPAAPSHVSALMSGVMVKTGVYMLVRLCLDILPGAPPWWGLLLLLAGALSSLLGVLYALYEHDLKKLLAYHSIENIGIIFLGFGSSLVFRSAGMNGPAMLGLAASLFHVLNHATFKALLFMGAGSVISATGTRNMEAYGGLIKVMPRTALYFLIGAMAISALPPFNGFFSEWLTFQTMFLGVGAFNAATKMVFIMAIGALALTGGLAAACFVKAFGVTFLARPRSREALEVGDPALPLRAGMASLALLTVALGFFSGMVSRGLIGITASLSAFSATVPGLVHPFEFSSAHTGFASLSMPVLFIVIVATTAAVAAAVVLTSGRRKIATGATWDCGADLAPRMEITATGFSRSIITVFRGVLKPTGQTETEYHDAKLRYFPKKTIVTMEFQDIYGAYFYKPLQLATLKLADEIKKIQIGNINVYILYIFLTLTGLLLMLAM